MIKHTIRTSDGDKEVNLTARLAIKHYCEECLGFEDKPQSCTVNKCALYPFRTGDAHSGKIMSKENKEANRLRMITRRSKLNTQDSIITCRNDYNKKIGVRYG